MRRTSLVRKSGCAIALLLAGASAAAAQTDEPVFRPRTVAEDLQMFSQVLNQIRVNHPDSVPLHDLFMAAIEGMIGAVDPHSYILPAHRLSPAKEKELRAGRLVPVPIDFSFVGLAPVVIGVDDGARASGLDIVPGDELVRIGDQAVRSRSASELMIELAGARGSSVDLTFERQRLDGSIGTLTRSVQRRRREQDHGLAASLMLDDRTGYVRITHFLSDDVADAMRSALEELEKAGATRLLLDLRGNGGGDPAQAGRVAGEFLPRGAVVYSVESRHEQLRRTVKVERSFLRPGGRRLPVIVLVDHGTASAAELLAAALQDHDRALVAGRPTFGKALLMQGLPLADGSTVMLVVGHVRTPCGRTIQREYRGLPPREYYRLAGRDRETAGLASCTTAGGRTLHGGDGVRPDIVFDAAPLPPVWYSQLLEQQVPFRWAAAFVAQHASAVPPPAQIRSTTGPPAEALSSFREFARESGVELPADANPLLGPVLLRTMLSARWGADAYHRVAAMLDPQVWRAVESFGAAEALPAGH